MAKVVDTQIIGNKIYYRLNSCTNEEYLDILEHRSFVLKSWKYGNERKYFSFMHVNKPDLKIIWSYIGYSAVLIRYLQNIGYFVNGKEQFRARPVSIDNMLYNLYDFQSEAVNAWINSGCCGVIKMPTGSGKTISACQIIKRLSVRTIIIVHTADLLINAWFNTLVEQFGENIKDKIGIIGGALSKRDRMTMRIEPNPGYESNIKKDIVIATAQSLLNKTTKICDEQFGLLIWDECHHVSAEQFNKVASAIRAVYRCGLTATLNRPDGTAPMIYGLMGDIVYKININELIQKKVLVTPIFNTIIINDEPIQRHILTCGLTKLELARYIKQLSASSTTKMNYIMKLAKNLSMSNKKFIMYADFVLNSNNRIYTRDFYVKALNSIGVKVIGVSSDMGGGEREKVFSLLENGKLDGLVFGKLGAEGVNIPKVDSVIMCNATKSTILFPQRVGRSMRTIKGENTKRNAFVYELVLNTPMEKRWSESNFYEYEVENYTKQVINIG